MKKICLPIHYDYYFFYLSERGFEDHENLVEPLSGWTRDSENKLHFDEREDKYKVFKNPQVSVQTHEINHHEINNVKMCFYSASLC